MQSAGNAAETHCHMGIAPVVLMLSLLIGVGLDQTVL